MKIYYFDTKGRAETARLVLRLGGVEFEDVRFSREDWGTKYKAMSPSGQSPFLETSDGKILTQSAAINVYCAEKAGMLPGPSNLMLARTIELQNTLEDLFGAVAPTFKIQDPEEKLAARKALIEPEGALTMKMNIIEKLVGACTTEFYCGDEPSLADVHLFTFFGTIRSGFLDGITASYVDGFEKISALRKKVANLEKVKALYGPDDIGYCD